MASALWLIVKPVWVWLLPYVGVAVKWSLPAALPAWHWLRSSASLVRPLALIAAVSIPLAIWWLNRDRPSEMIHRSELTAVQSAVRAEIEQVRRVAAEKAAAEAAAIYEQRLARAHQELEAERNLRETQDELRANSANPDGIFLPADDPWLRGAAATARRGDQAGGGR